VERVADNRNIDRQSVNSTSRPAYCSSNITAASAAMTTRLVGYNTGLFQGTTPNVCLSQQVSAACVAASQLSWQLGLAASWPRRRQPVRLHFRSAVIR
jgi:hypothetical protein